MFCSSKAHVTLALAVLVSVPAAAQDSSTEMKGVPKRIVPEHGSPYTLLLNREGTEVLAKITWKHAGKNPLDEASVRDQREVTVRGTKGASVTLGGHEVPTLSVESVELGSAAPLPRALRELRREEDVLRFVSAGDGIPLSLRPATVSAEDAEKMTPVTGVPKKITSRGVTRFVLVNPEGTEVLAEIYWNGKGANPFDDPGLLDKRVITVLGEPGTDATIGRDHWVPSLAVEAIEGKDAKGDKVYVTRPTAGVELGTKAALPPAVVAAASDVEVLRAVSGRATRAPRNATGVGLIEVLRDRVTDESKGRRERGR